MQINIKESSGDS